VKRFSLLQNLQVLIFHLIPPPARVPARNIFDSVPIFLSAEQVNISLPVDLFTQSVCVVGFLSSRSPFITSYDSRTDQVLARIHGCESWLTNTTLSSASDHMKVHDTWTPAEIKPYTPGVSLLNR
jgi:hypothetical protein